MEILGSGAEAYLRISPNTNTGTAAVVFGTADDHSTGGIYYNGSDDSLVLAGHNNDERFRIDSSGRLLTGGATSVHGSTNADDLVIGANNQSNQTGITLGSASGSSIRFADASDDTAGSVYYIHGDESIRLYARSRER